MSTIESPLNKAHRHATNAEDALAQGLWVKAAEEHTRAADAFLVCINGANDESTTRTLRLLYDEHCKQAKDIERKISKLREEGKDPNLRQPPQRPSVTASSSFAGSSRDSGPIDESFMMLPGQRSELSSSFNHFWKVLEGMLDQLSQPVAFATAPLHSPIREQPSSNHLLDTSPKQAGSYPPSKPDEVDDDIDLSWDMDSDDEFMSESFYVVPTESQAPPKVTRTHLAQLEEENNKLKSKLEMALDRVADMERVVKERIGHEQQLRDSIMQAQKAITSSQMFNQSQPVIKPGLDDTRRGPVALLQPSGLPRLSSLGQYPLSAQVASKPNPSQPNDAALASRITELEEKVRLLQVQDLTQKATIAKYKERWDKVKDSMKRKKLAKATAEAQRIAEENRIEEEVEPE